MIDPIGIWEYTMEIPWWLILWSILWSSGKFISDLVYIYIAWWASGQKRGENGRRIMEVYEVYIMCLSIVFPRMAGGNMTAWKFGLLLASTSAWANPLDIHWTKFLRKPWVLQQKYHIYADFPLNQFWDIMISRRLKVKLIAYWIKEKPLFRNLLVLSSKAEGRFSPKVPCSTVLSSGVSWGSKILPRDLVSWSTQSA